MARKAALYLRSSKDRHDVSVDSQRRELYAYAKTIGDVIVVEFSDKVESAKTDDRPAFQALIDEVRSKNCRFSALYCYDTSRFSRRQYHAQIYKQLLKRKGIELTFLKLPKTDTILDPIIESLMEAFDEFHSQKSKMDGLRGMRENIEQGWRAGGKAIHGYKLVPVRKVGISGIGAGGKRPRSISQEAVRRTKNSSRPLRASTDRSLPRPRGSVAAAGPPLASRRAPSGAGCCNRSGAMADSGVRPAWDAGEPGASGCGRTPPIGHRP